MRSPRRRSRLSLKAFARLIHGSLTRCSPLITFDGIWLPHSDISCGNPTRSSASETVRNDPHCFTSSFKDVLRLCGKLGLSHEGGGSLASSGLSSILNVQVGQGSQNRRARASWGGRLLPESAGRTPSGFTLVTLTSVRCGGTRCNTAIAATRVYGLGDSRCIIRILASSLIPTLHPNPWMNDNQESEAQLFHQQSQATGKSIAAASQRSSRAFHVCGATVLLSSRLKPGTLTTAGDAVMTLQSSAD